MTQIRVLIADDHPPTRAGVRLALEADGIEVCAEAADAASAARAAARERPDACLLDIHMPGSGIRAAAQIAHESPETAILMLTVSRSDDDLFDAIRAGAVGYLLKDTDPARLGAAVRGALGGEAALPRALVARVLDELRERPRRRLSLQRQRGPELTSREWEVLELLRQGLSTAEVAGRLFIAPVTVRRHVGEILRKLHLTSRQELLELH